MKSTPEGKVKKEVTQYLTKRGHFWLDLKTMGTFDPKLGKYRKSPYTKPGTPDLVCTPNGQAVFLELKREKGGRLSPDQILMREIIKNAGCEWYLIRSVKDVIAIGL